MQWKDWEEDDGFFFRGFVVGIRDADAEKQRDEKFMDIIMSHSI